LYDGDAENKPPLCGSRSMVDDPIPGCFVQSQSTDLPRSTEHPRMGFFMENFMIQKLELFGGGFTLIDEDDFEWLSKWKWRKDGRYVRRSVGLKKIFMHRQILGAKEGQFVDHINGDPFDNRKKNLRFATCSQNGGNSKKQINNSSGYKGVIISRYKKRIYYEAAICCEGRRYYLGTFKNPIEAAKAYDRKAMELFGEFARTNFAGIE